jgi:hypothetical protein
MELWEIFVPTIRNDGVPYRTRFHRVWDAKVRKIAGGLTIFTPAKGQWISPTGDLFHERMIPVRIACTEDQIDQILKMTREYYDQEAVMAYQISSKVKIYSK